MQKISGQPQGPFYEARLAICRASPLAGFFFLCIVARGQLVTRDKSSEGLGGTPSAIGDTEPTGLLKKRTDLELFRDSERKGGFNQILQRGLLTERSGENPFATIMSFQVGAYEDDDPVELNFGAFDNTGDELSFNALSDEIQESTDSEAISEKGSSSLARSRSPVLRNILIVVFISSLVWLGRVFKLQR